MFVLCFDTPFSVWFSGSGGPWPEWVNELVEDGSLFEVFKFSKFMTGMAWLYGDKLDMKPSWLDMLEDESLVSGGKIRYDRL